MIIPYIFEIVISKLDHWEESSLVILLVIDKISKVGFHDAFLFFSLAIRL